MTKYNLHQHIQINDRFYEVTETKGLYDCHECDARDLCGDIVKSKLVFGLRCTETLPKGCHLSLVHKQDFEALTAALRIIREAGNNEDQTAQWMQEWAAYAIEPWKFPRPSLLPPEKKS